MKQTIIDFIVAIICMFSMPIFAVMELCHIFRHSPIGEKIYCFWEGADK